MMQTIRIFISSPGDVAEERQIAGKVIERLQGKYWSFVRLDDVFWEQKVIRSTAHYQDELINPGDCEMVVGILWSRLGSLMPEKFRKASGERYQSGTEWELEMAFDAYEQSIARTKDATAAKPDIIVYRRNQPRPHFEDPVQEALADEQITKLDGYLRANFWFADGTIKRPVTNYASIAEFEEKLSHNLEELILRQIPGLKPGFEPPPISGSPFKGLQAFDFVDNDRYFGRNREIREIQQKLITNAGKGLPFVLIYGGSGYGKSSLMRAGLVPIITRPGGSLDGIQGWRRVPFQPAKGSGNLCERLARSLLQSPSPEEAERCRQHRHWPLTGLPELADNRSDIPSWDSARLTRHFSDDDQRPSAISAVAETLESLNRHLLLEIDQLEELFTTPAIDGDQRALFLRTIGDLCLTGRVWVVATMRSDFFPRVAEQPELFALVGKDRGYILPPPDRQSLREMIRYPVLAARLDFERRIAEIQIAGELAKYEYLDDQILSDAESSPDALPLLEFTLQQIYEEKSGTFLTWEAYSTAGGLKGSIAKRAREVYDEFVPVVREARHRIFAALVHVDATRNIVTRKRAPLNVLREALGAHEFLQAFIGNHLLITDENALTGEAIVTLAHEALLSHWDELATWIKDHRGDLLAQQRLTEQTQLWVENGMKKSYLLSDARLAEAERVNESSLFDLTYDQNRFLLHSKRRAKRKLRLLYAAVSLFAIIAITAVALGSLAREQTQNAKKQTSIAHEQTKRADDESKRSRQALSRVSYQNARVLSRSNNPDAALPHFAAALEADRGNRLAAAGFLENLTLIPRFIPEVLLLEKGDPCNLMETSPTGKRLAVANRRQLHIFALGNEPKLLRSISLNEHPNRLIWSKTGEELMMLSGSLSDNEVIEASRRASIFDSEGILRFDLERVKGIVDATIITKGNLITQQLDGSDKMLLECHDSSGVSVWTKQISYSIGMLYRKRDDSLLTFMMSKEIMEVDPANGEIKRITKIKTPDSLSKYFINPGVENNFDLKVKFSPDGDKMALAVGRDQGTTSDGSSQGIFGCILEFSTKNGDLMTHVLPEWEFSHESLKPNALNIISREKLRDPDPEESFLADGCYIDDFHYSASGDELVAALRHGGTLRIQLSDEPEFCFYPPFSLSPSESPWENEIEVNFEKVGFFKEEKRSFAFSPSSRTTGTTSPLLPFVQFWEVTENGAQEFALCIQDKDRLVAVAPGGDSSTFVTAHASGALVLRRLSRPWRESRQDPLVVPALDEPVVKFTNEDGIVNISAVNSGKVIAALELQPGQEVIAASAERGLVVLGPQQKKETAYTLHISGKEHPISFGNSIIKNFALSTNGELLWLVLSNSENTEQILHTVVTDSGKIRDAGLKADRIVLLRGTNLAYIKSMKKSDDKTVINHEIRELVTGSIREEWSTSDDDEKSRSFSASNINGFYFEGEFLTAKDQIRIRLIDSDAKIQYPWIYPSERLHIDDLNDTMISISPDLSTIYVATRLGKYEQGGFSAYDLASGAEVFPMRDATYRYNESRKEILFSPDGKLIWLELRHCLLDAQTGLDCGTPSVPIRSGCFGSLSYDLTRRTVYDTEPVYPELATAFSRAIVGEEFINGVVVPVSWPNRLSAAKTFSRMVSELR